MTPRGRWQHDVDVRGSASLELPRSGEHVAAQPGSPCSLRRQPLKSPPPLLERLPPPSQRLLLENASVASRMLMRLAPGAGRLIPGQLVGTRSRHRAHEHRLSVCDQVRPDHPSPVRCPTLCALPASELSAGPSVPAESTALIRHLRLPLFLIFGSRSSQRRCALRRGSGGGAPASAPPLPRRIASGIDCTDTANRFQHVPNPSKRSVELGRRESQVIPLPRGRNPLQEPRKVEKSEPE